VVGELFTSLFRYNASYLSVPRGSVVDCSVPEVTVTLQNIIQKATVLTLKPQTPHIRIISSPKLQKIEVFRAKYFYFSTKI